LADPGGVIARINRPASRRDTTLPMTNDCCPHCGSRLPIVRDGFCVVCREPLDEPLEVPRTPQEQQAFRARLERETRETLHWLGWLLKFIHG
jgi:hypothetical protein